MPLAEKKVVVTGGSGRLGGMVVRELLGAGYEVLSLDLVPPREKFCETWICDLRRAGDVYEALRGAAAVVHLGAYQAAGIAPACETFNNNVTATYNVLKAATDMGVRRVVVASSVAVYGFLYAPELRPPEYLPLDEDYPLRPQDPYALSKVFGEQLADAFVSQSDLVAVSLRFSGVNFDPAYESLPERWADPGLRLGTFWSYIDARDAARACLLALAKKLVGHHVFNIAADSSRYREPTAELIQKYLPGTRIRDGFAGSWGGLDCRRAETVLGFRARHVWQNYLRPDGTPIK